MVHRMPARIPRRRFLQLLTAGLATVLAGSRSEFSAAATVVGESTPVEPGVGRRRVLVGLL
jgi:hypothetical protein